MLYPIYSIHLRLIPFDGRWSIHRCLLTMSIWSLIESACGLVPLTPTSSKPSTSLRYFWQMGIYVHQAYLASHLFPLANMYLAEISSSISPLPDSKFVLLSSQNGHITFILFQRSTVLLNNPQQDRILATQHRLVPICTPHDFSANVLGIFSPPDT